MAGENWTPGRWDWSPAQGVASGKMEALLRDARVFVLSGGTSRDIANVGLDRVDEANANARLMAAAKDLYAALAGFLSVFWPTADEGHTGFVDRLGMQFYEETRIWPPFKSEPMEIARPDVDRDAAHKAWREWLDAKRDAAAAAARAALAKARGETP